MKKTLSSFKNIHKGSDIMVCGCGESLNNLKHPECFITIGVNDVGRLFQPNYLVVVNPRQQFTGERFQYVETSKSEYLFTQLDLGVPHPNVIKFKLGTYGGTDISDPNVLHYTQNSPYVAICLAALMGAKRIGLIGVDFTDNHFFGKTGRHNLAHQMPKIDAEYCALRQTLEKYEIEVFNLSNQSRLTAFEKSSPYEFMEMCGLTPAQSWKDTPLRIVSYATTPIAGVPAILARCINATTKHRARCVWETNGYGNGVTFAGDVEWKLHPTEAEDLIAEADLIISHNGKIHGSHQKLLKDKPVITLAHNYLWNVDTTYVSRGFPGLVVAQYQATLPEFKGWAPVPNPVPLWERDYQGGEKDGSITLCYAPSGKHEQYPEGHRLFWHAKGYDTTMRVLDRLEQRYRIKVEALRYGQVSHAESLAMKRRAHIVIDECVTGSYHRCSLEGLAAGCVVVNGVGLLDGVIEVLGRCAPDATNIPFLHADLSTLEQVLNSLIKSGIESLSVAGRRNREWMERHWNFKAQWQTHWCPAIEHAINRIRPRYKVIDTDLSQTCIREPALLDVPRTADSELSVVVPFGGQEHIGLLEASVSGLRQSDVVDQVIIVELGSQPLALDVARRSGSDYLFIHWSGAFDKSRALNTGSSLARNPEILWCDADLLFRKEFLGKALQEFRACHLDFFYPFFQIEYLSESDSKRVLSGERDLSDCGAVSTMKPLSHVPGGMGIVRAELLRNFGGMIEGFLGWGGEDNAWTYKAALVGRVGATRCPDQVVWHLYHPGSSSAGAQPWRKNPHYARNVSLLSEVRHIKTVAELMRKFPPPAHAATPWVADARICFVVVGIDPSGPLSTIANGWSKRIEAIYGISVPVRISSPTDLNSTLENQDFDVIVAFVEEETSCRAFTQFSRNNAAIMVIGCQELSSEMGAVMFEVPCVLARTWEQIENLRRHGVRVWHVAWGSISAESTAAPPLIVQPLSLVLGSREISGGPVTPHDFAISREHYDSRDPQNLLATPKAKAVRLPGLSVVIPHTGSARMPSLAASLANLAQCEGLDEIIVVELGIKAYARTTAARWGARYVFVRHEGPFERARALNIGTTLASHELVMWKDGDLLLPQHFASQAREEMNLQEADFFLPYSSINCLTEDDSHEVMRGTRSPADCKPTVVWRGGISNGGVGIVRAVFVDQFGGLEESFRGWGYEDWAWWHKARLLGRTAVTHNQSQVLYHLYHPTAKVSENNKALFQEFQAISSVKELLTHFPRPRFASCPWPTNKRIMFIAGKLAHVELAHTLAQNLLATYGQESEVLKFDPPESDTNCGLYPSSADAFVVFEERIAETVLTQSSSNAFASNILVVVGPTDEPEITEGSGNLLRDGSGSTSAVQRWTSPLTLDSGPIPRHAALAFVDPLSLLLGRPEETQSNTLAPLAVWTYWEGPCPDWIRACLSTFRKHAPQVRILNPASFDALRVHDRDIDLQRIDVAHRADFIRAYLLAHFGGLWLDADCLLMHPPTEIFDRLKTVDFIAHRDRQGWFPNGFMAASLGSRIARELYERICNRLRDGGNLAWTSLGSEPLTDILHSTDVLWHELGCQRIQPICWSLPSVFFERQEHATHEAKFKSDALCYMLSNTEVCKYLSLHPEENLLSENTFFRFLLGKAFREPDSAKVIQPRSLLAVPFAVECIEAIGPSSVLQIGTDSILYAALVRDWWYERMRAGDSTISTHLEVIRLGNGNDAGYGLDVFDRIHECMQLFPSPSANLNWCLIVFTAASIRQARDSLESLLKKALSAAAYVLMPTESDFLGECISTLGARVVREGAEDSCWPGGFLLSLDDPLGLRRPAAAQSVFERFFRENEARAQESLSGPGSTLAQTSELRQRLPLLLQHIGAKSLLDAGCGDFNWMQHVNLGVDRYIGVDIIPNLIMNNRRRFGKSTRIFEVRDIMCEHLPRSDVILCRDCLVHFSITDIQRTLRNFQRCGALYILTTSFPRVRRNTDNETGDWRPINLEQAPFHFPKPIAMINEKCTEAQGRYNDKSLGLWMLVDAGSGYDSRLI